MGAANADDASNPHIKPLKARHLNAVITNLLFAQPRAAVLAALRTIALIINLRQSDFLEPRLRSGMENFASVTAL